MLELPNVTIWTMVWKDDRKWILRAGEVLRYCGQIIKCQEMVLFTSLKIAQREYPWRTVYVPQMDWQGYNIFINRVVPNEIKSDFAMQVHEDGFPLDTAMWRDEFLNYDFIGAPWPDKDVGNAGFSIESRKLMDIKSVMPMSTEDFNLTSDRLVCTARKKYLEERGIRFAPFDTAVLFSTEHVGKNIQSFGFHGRTVAVDKYHQGWQIINRMKATKDGFYKVGNKIVPPVRGAFSEAIPAEPVKVVEPEIAEPEANNRYPTSGKLTVAMVYVFPTKLPQFADMAKRFVASYVSNPPDYPLAPIIVCNGGAPQQFQRDIFSPIRGAEFMVHDNSGYDLGAFQYVARRVKSDVMLFIGSSTFMPRKGWLSRAVQAVERRGNGLYGTMHNTGDKHVNVYPHIRTTGFWMPRELFNRYPLRIQKPQQRYEFEHGKSCLTEWVKRIGFDAWVVTWDKEYPTSQWANIPNSFHRGNQSGLVFRDRLTEPPYYA